MRRLLLLAGLLVGCSPAVRHTGVTLRFWALGREGEVVQRLVGDFEQANPGVRVIVQQIPWTAAHEKLLTAYVGDAMPDLAQVGNTWIPEFVTLGALAALDDLLAHSSVVDRADYFRGIWDTNVVGGRLVGVPWYVDTRVLFYRTDILAEAGFTAFPRTWEEWLAAMRRIKALPGREHYAIFLPTDEWAQPVILGMAAGASLLKDGDELGDFSGTRFRQAFEFYIDLFRERLAPIAGNTQLPNVYQPFAEGTFAMYITGPWNLGEFRRRLPPSMRDRWTTAPMPAPRAEEWPGTSLAGGSSLVILRSCRHRGAAWRLIEFLSQPGQQERFYRLTGDLPPRKSAWADPVLADDPQAQAFRVQLEHVRPTPKVPEWERIATKVYEDGEAAIRGRASVEQTLARLDADVDGILAKRRWMLAHTRGTR